MQHTHRVFSLITYFLQNIYELEAQLPFLYFTSKSLEKALGISHFNLLHFSNLLRDNFLVYKTQNGLEGTP